jgi:hypothetical protein
MWRSAYAPSNFNVINGDLVLLPTDHGHPTDFTSVAHVPRYVLTDTSIRAQIRATGVGDNFGVALIGRIVESTFDGYWAGVKADGTLTIHKSGAPNSDIGILLASTPSALTPQHEDVVLQFDLIGNQLSLYAWRPGQSKPSVPQLRASDSRFPRGSAGVILDFPPVDGTGTFRFVHVSNTPIPEPSGSSLALASAGLLAFAVLFGRFRFQNVMTRC